MTNANAAADNMTAAIFYLPVAAAFYVVTTIAGHVTETAAIFATSAEAEGYIAAIAAIANLPVTIA
jgi:hypothetical protein